MWPVVDGEDGPPEVRVRRHRHRGIPVGVVGGEESWEENEICRPGLWLVCWLLNSEIYF